MRTFKKIFVTGLLIALIVWAVPFFTGQLVEKKYEDILSALSEFEAVTLTPVSYERGWLTSTATSRLMLEDPGLQGMYQQLVGETGDINPTEPLYIKLQHKIFHGPFIRKSVSRDRKWLFAQAYVQSALYLTPQAKEILRAQVGTSEVLNIETMVAIDGSANITLQGPPLTFEEGPGEPPSEWKGLTGKWKLSQNLKSLTGEMVLPGFDVDIYDTHLFSEDMVMKTTRTKKPDGIWMRQGTFSMHALEISDPSFDSIIKFAGVNAGGTIKQDDKLVDTFGTFHVENFEVLGFNGGPAEYAFSLRNIDPRFFAILEKLESQSAKQGMNSEAVDWQTIQEMMSLLPAFLQNRPELSVDTLHVVTTEGDIKGKLKMVIGGQEANLANPQAIVNSLKVDGHLSLPQVLFRKMLTGSFKLKMESTLEGRYLSERDVSRMAENKIQGLVHAGILNQKEKDYVIEIQVDAGRLIINGEDYSERLETSLMEALR